MAEVSRVVGRSAEIEVVDGIPTPSNYCIRFVPRETPEGLSMREWVQFQIDEMQRSLLELEQQIAQVEFAMQQRAQLSAMGVPLISFTRGSLGPRVLVVWQVAFRGLFQTLGGGLAGGYAAPVFLI